MNSISRILRTAVAGLITIFITNVVSAETLILNAQYSIPVTSNEELAVNTFDLANYQVNIESDSQALMSFDLPEDMTGVRGQKLKFALKGKLADGTKILSSRNGKAICKGLWVNMECSFVFKNINTNERELKKIVKAKMPAHELEMRLKLLKSFSNDPIGVAKVWK